MQRHTTHLFRRLAFPLLAASASIAFFGVVLHHVHAFDFKPLAAFCLPILVVFFGFTSLLYIRGNSLAKGKHQVRTVFAAERSMQATVFYLAGIAVGASVYGLMRYAGYSFDPAHPTAAGLWLLVFLAPYALMQTGFLLFMSAACLIAPQFLRPVRLNEISRRIARGAL